ncbi:DUF6758 family protein [Micromonospora sp. NPDC050397]|uniref:DUF6758 family protein n=1 Tax=Micromonospora sp. NPDC050397 TaxID=3364279 RepID=UPI00384FD5C5
MTPPDLMNSEWRCADCGPVSPLQVAERVGPGMVETVTARIGDTPEAVGSPMPLWCLWPLPPGWVMAGAAWAGDDRTGVRATAVACSGPAPLGGGPADLVLVAEEPGVGLGTRFAGIPGPDPGALLADVMADELPGHAENPAHAKVRADGHPAPLWSVKSPTDRSAYVGEARGRWLYAITWPSSAGYLLAEDVVLHDLSEWLPPELVYGAPSPYLHGLV